MRTMSGVQVDVSVVVDASGAVGDQLMACVSTLVAEAGSVTVQHAALRDQMMLIERFGTLVRVADAEVAAAMPTAAVGAILTTTAQVAFADGSLSRLADNAAAPGRIVTRVLVSGAGDVPIAWWSAAWAADHGLTPLDLAGADLAFDRTHLPHDSPQARAWVRGDDLGVVPVENIGTDVMAWARAEGRRLDRYEHVAALRSRAGAVKRRWMLRRQRRQSALQRVR